VCAWGDEKNGAKGDKGRNCRRDVPDRRQNGGGATTAEKPDGHQKSSTGEKHNGHGGISITVILERRKKDEKTSG